MRIDGMVLVAVLLLASPSGAAESGKVPASSTDDLAALTADVATIMADRKIPGAQVAIVMHDGTTWERSFGVRDLASGAPMIADTLIQAGSVTKIFTASLVADLVAKGSLRWSDTLAARLPGTPIRSDLAGITLEELVTHTARLPANPPNRIDIDGVMQPYSVAQLHASLTDPTVNLVDPGRTYSNWGYALLGHIVEKVTGKRFEDVLGERIFRPLGMARSKITLSASDERALATHYWPEDKPRIPRPPWIFGEVAGFGGITTTAGDLAKFLRYQIQPDGRADVLDPIAIQSLRAVRVLSSSWQSGGARGWILVRDSDGTITIEHSGEVDGHSSYIGFSPDVAVGVAVTANLGGSSAREIALPVLARALVQGRRLQPANRANAMALAKNRRWADAEAALVKVVATTPDDGPAWYELGLVRYELRNLPGAETALLRSTERIDNATSSLYMLAIIAASQGRTDTAFDRLASAVSSARDPLDLDRIELRVLQTDARWTKIVERGKRVH